MKMIRFKRKKEREMDREIQELREEYKASSERVKQLYQERQLLLQQYEKNTETLCQLKKEIEKIMETKTFS